MIGEEELNRIVDQLKEKDKVAGVFIVVLHGDGITEFGGEIPVERVDDFETTAKNVIERLRAAGRTRPN